MNDLIALCRRLVDPCAQPTASHGTTAIRMAAAGGEVIVKRHRRDDRLRQEVHAYHNWTPALGDRAPRLIAVSHDPPAIVATALPGLPLSEAVLQPDKELRAYRQAGTLLRDLHNAAPPRDSPDMTAWLAERGQLWLEQAEDLLPAHRRAEINAHLRALALFGPLPAVPCHLDYMPRNLLVTGAGEIAVVDFEHSRYDLAGRDLVRLATRVWSTRPHLEKGAFPLE
jgi:Ser/Thr protein kinase RdoA (MazF antagonist)